MLVPQSMAYALLAGLPPVVGLYASALPLLAYPLLGSSRHLAVGPVAMASLLTLTGLSAVASPGSPQYVSLALLLALMVGALQLASSLLGLGFLVNFLSGAVVGGFTTAAALIIALGQLGALLGVDAPSASGSALGTLAGLASGFGSANLPTLFLGLSCAAALAAARRRAPRLPSQLLVVAAAALAVVLLGLEGRGIETVGEVPRGLPPVAAPPLDAGAAFSLSGAALAITLVGFVELTAIAKAVARKEGYRVNPNAELRGLGLANVAASFSGGYPVAGSFSRTAVAHRAGAGTKLAGALAGLLVLASLLALAPLFSPLPKAALAAVVIAAVWPLADFHQPLGLWRVKRTDALAWGATFVAALAFGPLLAIGAGVAVSVGMLVWRSSRPNLAEEGYIEAADVFRDVRNFPEAKTFPEALVVRPDGALHFANASFLEDNVLSMVAEREGREPGRLRHVVLDFGGVNELDATAAGTLEGLVAALREKGLRVMLSRVKGPVRERMRRAGLWGLLGGDARHLSTREALRSVGLLPEGEGVYGAEAPTDPGRDGDGTKEAGGRAREGRAERGR